MQQVRIIVSGVGDYRYVDCAAIRAGKQEALEYIRALFNIPLSQCVAAGDSGNDILMLEGAHADPATISLPLSILIPALKHGSMFLHLRLCLRHAQLCYAGKHRGIIVGNAQQELLDWLIQQEQSDRVVCTDAHMALGILEGIARHGLY